MNGLTDTIKQNINKVIRAKNFMIMLAVVQTLFSALYFFNANYSHKQVELFYQARLDSLKVINERYEHNSETFRQVQASLEQKLSQKDSLLSIAKEKLENAKFSVNTILNSNWSSLNPEQKSGKCDSLRDQVVRMEFQQSVKDTITETKISLLTSLCTEKDKQIQNCNLAFAGMKGTLEQSISDNKSCANQFEKLDKWMTKLRRRNRVAGILAVAGISLASGFIIHTQIQ